MGPFNAVMTAIENGRPGAFFIDAPGGTGKSYVLNTILAAVRLMSVDSIAIAVAASGIAATSLLKGRTLHSRFKANLQVTETSSLNISKQSTLADLIRRARLTVWDEAPMNNRFLLEALDRFLKDIADSSNRNLPFGGKPILLSGDFRQILPVVKRGSRAKTVDAVINRSHLWKHFKIYRLTENMRVLRNGDDNHLREFVKWLLDVGEGKLMLVNSDSDQSQDFVILNPENCFSIESESRDNLLLSMRHLINFVYPHAVQNMYDRKWMAERAILAPVNIAFDDINEMCPDLIPGVKIECFSTDSTVELGEATRFPTEYLNSLSLNGIPPHRLVMKIGGSLMLLRNINANAGLCNGTRLILQSIHGQMLRCQIAGGQRYGAVVFLPQITFTPAEDEGFPGLPRWLLTNHGLDVQTAVWGNRGRALNNCIK